MLLIHRSTEADSTLGWLRPTALLCSVAGDQSVRLPANITRARDVGERDRARAFVPCWGSEGFWDGGKPRWMAEQRVDVPHLALHPRDDDKLEPVTKPVDSTAQGQPRRVTGDAKWRAIEELKRRGKESWGATYYSQMAPAELCALAGRQRPVQYGALISWLKRLGSADGPDPEGAISLVMHLLAAAPNDPSVVELAAGPVAARGRARRAPRTNRPRAATLVVNCPDVIHDHRFVLVGELPDERLFPAVFLQPQDGSGLWYPQVAQHNPLRAGRAFACLVRLGNPGGIWHDKKPPLDAKVRTVALEREWDKARTDRLPDDALEQALSELTLIARKDAAVSRVAIEPIEPQLSDAGQFAQRPLRLSEPRAERCVAPVRLQWKGGAAYIEIREGRGDRLVFGGTAAPGATLTLRGKPSVVREPNVLFVLDQPGPYRVRLYPAVWSFVDPPYEWWIDVS